jgi:hypothetical protein
MLKGVTHLNFHERDLLERLVQTDTIDWAAGSLTLMTFRLDVADPSGQLPETEFGCGFAVVRQDPDVAHPYLCALRIPDHLRSMGLARRAIIALAEHLGSKPRLAPRREPIEAPQVAAAQQPGEAGEAELNAQAMRKRFESGREALASILDSIDG